MFINDMSEKTPPPAPKCSPLLTAAMTSMKLCASVHACALVRACHFTMTKRQQALRSLYMHRSPHSQHTAYYLKQRHKLPAF